MECTLNYDPAVLTELGPASQFGQDGFLFPALGISRAETLGVSTGFLCPTTHNAKGFSPVSPAAGPSAEAGKTLRASMFTTIVVSALRSPIHARPSHLRVSSPVRASCENFSRTSTAGFFNQRS